MEPCLITPSANNSNFLCFSGIFEAYDNETRKCSCNVACNEFSFNSVVSTSTWPSNQYWFDMATQDLNYILDQKDKNGKDALEIRTGIQEDYTRADVYYQTLNVRSIIQNEAYPVIKKCEKSSFCKNKYFFRLNYWYLVSVEP